MATLAYDPLLRCDCTQVLALPYFHNLPTPSANSELPLPKEASMFRCLLFSHKKKRPAVAKERGTELKAGRKRHHEVDDRSSPVAKRLFT